MTKDTQSLDARMRAKALARWEGEGGALAPTAEVDSIDEPTLRILARLGAALLDEWGDIPPAAQSNIIRGAKALGASGDHARVKGNLARFLKQHRSEC
jgi:hypothetical protein